MPTSPRSLCLMGRDPSRGTYHWEGPQPGTVWETAPDKLFGWLVRWTEPEDGDEVSDEDGKPIHYLANPQTQDWRPAEEEGKVVVFNKETGRGVLKIKTERLFVLEGDLIQSPECKAERTSPYAFAAAVMRGELVCGAW